MLPKLFGWPVVSAVVALLLGAGLNAMYGDDYSIANCLYLAAVLLLTAKIWRWEETKNLDAKKRGATLAVTLILAVVIFFMLQAWTTAVANRHHGIKPQSTTPATSTGQGAKPKPASPAAKQATTSFTTTSLPHSTSLPSLAQLPMGWLGAFGGFLLLLVGLVLAAARRRHATKPSKSRPVSTATAIHELTNGHGLSATVVAVSPKSGLQALQAVQEIQTRFSLKREADAKAAEAEERLRRLRDSPAAPSAPVLPYADLKRRASALAAEIAHFVALREAADPGRFPHPMAGLAGTFQMALQSVAHSQATIGLYFERFGERLSLIIQECAAIGLVDDQLNSAYLRPEAEGALRLTAARLNVLCIKIPSP